MTIREIRDEIMEHLCESCGHIRTIAMHDLNPGVIRDGQMDPSLIAMPPCQACGAREFLVQSKADEPDHPAPGSFGHKHRLLVDVLAARLTPRPNPEDEPSPRTFIQRAPKEEENKLWFKDGLKLSKPASVEQGGQV